MASHPVEVVGRIRQNPEGREGQSALSVSGRSVRLRCEQGYRDFTLDGVSLAEEENVRSFYKRYVEARVEDVRAGARCTVMMYGPTGAGKSHTMFGNSKENGVAYLALHQIMRNKVGGPDGGGLKVVANVLEIYNEEVYDLLASNCIASPGPKSLKPMLGRARLEVRGRKVKNATCISGADPAKLVQEIVNVEKRRVVKSTTSNSRSSRSHCMVILDVPTVGGRLVLVDMAGSENSDQAGCGSEAKLQTGKINQGNAALKRVVECIVNGDTYIPYRDSKLTMLLQDSFEEDGAKILMILCANPELRDAYKTICTFEYGAKAKCIVRLPSSPPKETATFADGMEATLLARLHFKDECIERLRREFEQKEQERAARVEELAKREQELTLLRNRTEKLDEERREKMAAFQKRMEAMVRERSEELRRELEIEMQMRVHKICPENGHLQLSEMERMIENQRQEIAVLRLRAERAESQLQAMRETSSSMGEVDEPTWAGSSDVVDMDISNSICISRDFSGSSNNNKTLGSFAVESFSSPTTGPEETKNIKDQLSRNLFGVDNEGDCDVELPWSEIGLYKTGWLPIIPEENDEAGEAPKPVEELLEPLRPNKLEAKFENLQDEKPSEASVPAPAPVPSEPACVPCSSPEKAASRKARIESIFLLCGNRREVAAKERFGFDSAPSSPISGSSNSHTPFGGFSPMSLPLSAPSTPTGVGRFARLEERRTSTPPELAKITTIPSRSTTEVHVKWESTKSGPGKLVCVVNLPSSSCLADLRTEIGVNLLAPSEFFFLILGDVGGAPVDREAESTLLVSSLPPCSENPSSRLACLRGSKSSPSFNPSPSPSPFSVHNQIGFFSPVPSRPKIRLPHLGDENVDPSLIAA